MSTSWPVALHLIIHTHTSPLCRTEMPPGAEKLCAIATQVYSKIVAMTWRGEVKLVPAPMGDNGWGTLSPPIQREWDDAMTCFAGAQNTYASQPTTRAISRFSPSLRSTLPPPPHVCRHPSEAADQGHVYSAYRVAETYKTGKGVPLDMAQAREFYEKAVRGQVKEEVDAKDASSAACEKFGTISNRGECCHHSSARHCRYHLL